MLEENKSTVTSYTIHAMIVWAIYTCAYIYLKSDVNTSTIAGYFSLVGEAGLDIVAATLVWSLWRKSEEKKIKYVFMFFFIAFIAAAVADGIYNVVLNLFKFQYINPVVVSLFDVPFAIFLFFQLLAWSCILFSSSEEIIKTKKSSYIPYAIVSVLIFTMFMFGIQWKIEYFSLLGFFQTVDTILEVTGFALATICLARARTDLIRFSAIGYLLIVSSDLIIRYHIISGIVPYLSPLEATWVLGLLLMCLGFFFNCKTEKLKPFDLLPVNSLQSQIAIWLLILWLSSAFLFAGSYYMCFQESGNHLNEITKNLLSMLVPFSVLAIISSNYISIKLSSPLSRLENIINNSIANDTTEMPDGLVARGDHYIFEFKMLENFVFDAFSLYKKKHSLEVEFAKTAAQVAHDVKSPLIALDNLSKNLVNIHDDQREIITYSINRINEITENLLVKHRSLNNHDRVEQHLNNSVEMIFPILNGLVLEKKVQYQDTNIIIEFVSDQLTESTFCFINPVEFKRVVSNLINNGIESLTEAGRVTIMLKQNFNNIIVEIKDNGCGMPKEVLSGLQNGISSKKERGNGLGLQHAIHCIKQWGGQYHIETKENIGTSFYIYLPIQSPPVWMQEEVYLYEDHTIVIVDDDQNISNLWREKLDKTFNGSCNITIVSLMSPEELRKYVETIEYTTNKTTFFVDYHFFNSNETGIDIINNYLMNEKFVLVTSCYPDSKMKEIILDKNIRVIFKKDIQKVPIYILYQEPDLILLDDKKLVTKTWHLQARKYNKKIVAFNHYEIFMNYIYFFNKNTNVYLDADLGDQSGIDIAKVLYENGFFNLYITTGFDKNDFEVPSWIKGVIDKKPVFINDSLRTYAV